MLLGLSPGHATLTARAIGYEATTVAVQLKPGVESARDLTLKPLPSQLRELVVAARMDSAVPSTLIDAYKRVEEAKGFFYTRREIDRINPRDLETLLNRVPTVSMNDRGLTFQRCQSGIPSRMGGNPHEQAKVQLWVDGFRVSGRNPTESVADLLRNIPPSSIEVLEIYTGTTRIPAEFLDDACAVIVVWTRRF